MPDDRGPRQFTDLAGRVWTLAITFLEHRKIREATGVKVGDLVDDGCKPLAELLGDPDRFCLVLWVLVRDQAAALGVNEEQFLKGLAGDPAEAAALRFVEALADFCPSQTRQLLLSLARKNQMVRTTAAELAAAELEAITPDRIRSALKGSASNSPESAGSIPDPGRSGNSPGPLVSA